MKVIDLKILDPRMNENIPSPATPGSAGLDLRACINSPYTLNPDAVLLVPTGLAIHIADPNYAALILPRSGLSHRYNLVLSNSVALIDSDYQGQIMLSLRNNGKLPFDLMPMERVAQLLLIPVQRAEFNITDSFNTSERGTSGFGSTGRN